MRRPSSDRRLAWWESDPRAPVFKKVYEQVWDLLPAVFGTGWRAIDLGSGNGQILTQLLFKGYDLVSGVESNPEPLERLRKEFPSVRLLSRDVSELPEDGIGWHNIGTMIFVSQYLAPEKLEKTLRWLRRHVDRLVIDVTNSRSFHQWWRSRRGFQGEWTVYSMAPAELEQMLVKAGFTVSRRCGIGLLTPVTLFPGFKWQIVPGWLARIVNCLDRFFPKLCHVYLVVAE